MMATVPHVTSGLGLKKIQADGFLLTRVHKDTVPHLIISQSTRQCKPTRQSSNKEPTINSDSPKWNKLSFVENQPKMYSTYRQATHN